MELVCMHDILVSHVYYTGIIRVCIYKRIRKYLYVHVYRYKYCPKVNITTIPTMLILHGEGRGMELIRH